MNAATYLCVLATLLILVKSWAAIIFEGPANLSRNPEDWAEFTCSVACSHSIDWYVEGFPGDITDTCGTTLNGMMVCKEVVQSCSSTTSTERYTERLRLLAKTELASSSVAVQCAALSRSAPAPNNCPPFLAYSRYALLTVREVATEPTPPPPTYPSPSPVVCPTSSQSVSISTQTETVTATVTVQHTVTLTVSPTATPPADIDPVISRGVSHSSHLGRLLTEILSWGVTVLAGVLIM